MACSAALLLDLAWAVVTVQLMLWSFYCSSEDILYRMRCAASPLLPLLPLHQQQQQQQQQEEEQQPVSMKKRRRLLKPKSVWDTEQVQRCLPPPVPIPTPALSNQTKTLLLFQVSIAFERAGVKPMWVNALHSYIANNPTCSSWALVPHVSCPPRLALQRRLLLPLALTSFGCSCPKLLSLYWTGSSPCSRAKWQAAA